MEPTAVNKEQHNKKQPMSSDLHVNMNLMKDAFSYPENTALKFRDVFLPVFNKKASILFVEGTVDTNLIDAHIVEPLLKKSIILPRNDEIVSLLIRSVLTTSNAKSISTFQDAIEDLVNGNTIILLEDESQAISVETIGFESRSVAVSTIETVIKGPKAAFIESAAVNRSLIRKQIKDSNLMCEMVSVGKNAPQQVSVMYIKEIADSELIKNVKKRLTDIDRDTILEISIVEQYIEDRPYSLFPSTLTTERPDRASSFLLEGHVVLLMENSPVALIVPITFWSLFHTVEDQYLRWAYGNFIRIIRLIALFIAILMPALYVAVTTYHAEMLPTDLMLAISSTREILPFPAIIEIFFMAITFEILREAGIRIPTALGPTIGIVGALILGQAAVDANIVSPILVIVIAITGLASFTIPDVGFNIAIRMLEFIFLLAGNFMGIFGVSLCLTWVIAYMVSIKSFGVPFFAPLSPHLPSSKDLLITPPVWKQWLRPYTTSPQKKIRGNKPEGGPDK
ncbi:spore germination protein [Bacillus sp. FJAT-29790]|nr:spore germination protein [Bacillus sp. FJAT-29790]